MGVHPHAAMKGVQSPCPLLVPVFREAYDRTKPTEEGRASALRGRLQSVDPTKLNARSSEVALAPRAAGRAQRRACGCVLVSVRLRLGASLLPWVTTAPSCQSRRGYRSLGTCSRSRGVGTMNRGGTLNRTKMV